MNVINLDVTNIPCRTWPIMLGQRRENGVTEVRLDYSAWIEDLGEGVILLMVKRPGDTSAYPVVLQTAEGVAVWTVSETDTQVNGEGSAEYVFMINDQRAKTAVFTTFTAPDMGCDPPDPPDPYEDWIETLTELAAETLQNAQDAAQSASDADDAKDAAEDAQGAAEDAQEAAEAAQEAAETAQSAAATAEENAEAWAVGERGGVPVTAGDPTYQNNAKHWADVAQQGAEESGFAWFDVDDSTGQMIVTVTANLAQSTSFAVNENTGILEVTVNG